MRNKTVIHYLTTDSNDLASSAGASLTRRMVHHRRRWLLPASGFCNVTIPNGSIGKANWISVKIYKWCPVTLRYDTSWMFTRNVVCNYVTSISWGTQFYGKDPPQRFALDSKHRECFRKVGAMATVATLVVVWHFRPTCNCLPGIWCNFATGNKRCRWGSELEEEIPVLLLEKDNSTQEATTCIYEHCNEKDWKRPLYPDVLSVAYARNGECPYYVIIYFC